MHQIFIHRWDRSSFLYVSEALLNGSYLLFLRAAVNLSTSWLNISTLGTDNFNRVKTNWLQTRYSFTDNLYIDWF